MQNLLENSTALQLCQMFEVLIGSLCELNLLSKSPGIKYCRWKSMQFKSSVVMKLLLSFQPYKADTVQSEMKQGATYSTTT